MKRKFNLFASIGLFVIFTLFSVSFVQADIFIQSKRHTDSYTMMGKTYPAQDLIITKWLSKDKFRSDEGNKSTIIVRLDINKVYVINHQEKSYSVIDLPIDLSKVLPPQAQQMMQMFNMKTTVTDTGETKKIRKWNCKKYVMNMQGRMININTEIWATKDIKIDYDTYKKFGEIITGLNPMFKDMGKELKKIEGLTIYSVITTNMMGNNIKTAEEVIEITKKSPPKGHYELPTGYKEVQFNPMERK